MGVAASLSPAPTFPTQNTEQSQYSLSDQDVYQGQGQYCLTSDYSILQKPEIHGPFGLSVFTYVLTQENGTLSFHHPAHLALVEWYLSRQTCQQWGLQGWLPFIGFVNLSVQQEAILGVSPARFLQPSINDIYQFIYSISTCLGQLKKKKFFLTM